MTLARCKKHGLKGIEHLCPHVKSAQESNKGIKIISVTDEFYGPFFLCHSCAETYEDLKRQDNLDEFYDSIVPSCIQCFSEWKAQHQGG